MSTLTDQELLRAYAESRSETAFAELVQRHVDLVYSAALRMLRDEHLAKDVAQGVFLALAQKGPQLTGHPVLSGWLHRAAQHLAANAVRSDVRRRAREQEAAAMNKVFAAESDAPWGDVYPHLDAALDELKEPDRDALMLRYFERKSAGEMARLLGISDEAAQKRVSRALERLREFLVRRGVTVGAGGLAALLSAHAVQASPAGLAATFAATALGGATAATVVSTTATLTKAIAMTTLQKTLLATSLAVLAGTGLFQARQAAHLQTEVQALQEQQKQLTAQFEQVQQERAAAPAAGAQKALDNAELARLQAEIAQLRQGLAQVESTNAAFRNEIARARGDDIPFVYPDAIKRTDYAFAGYSTPTSGLQSLLWAITKMDAKVFQSSLAGDMAQVFGKQFQELPDGVMPGGFRNGEMYRAKGFRILEQTPLENNEVRLKVFLEGGRTPIYPVFQQINGEWKWSRNWFPGMDVGKGNPTDAK